MIGSLASKANHKEQMPDHGLGLENCPEQREPIELDVKGNMPSWLSGVLYRTGPGTFSIPAKNGKNYEISHWFDGLALHHRFEITPKGKVYYRNRRGADGVAENIEKNGEYPHISFAQRDPCQTFFRRFFTIFKAATAVKPPDATSSNINVTLSLVLPWASSLASEGSPHQVPEDATKMTSTIVAKTDANILQLLDADTLEPLKIFSYGHLDKELKGPLSAAHSCRDKETMYNYNLELGPSPCYRVFSISNIGEAKILARIKDAPPAYLHSFFMTEKFVVLCVWQCDFSGYGLPILSNRNFVDSFKPWNPSRQALFYVISKSAPPGEGLVAKFTSSPFFAFHCINAYEETEEDSGSLSIVADVSSYEDAGVLNRLKVDALRGHGHPFGENDPMDNVSFRRFRLRNIPVPNRAGTERNSTIKVQQAEVDFDIRGGGAAIELPVVAPDYYHRPYRYAYGISRTSEILPNQIADSITKVDTHNPSDLASHLHWKDPDGTPGEPIFVPRPGGTEEDDGVLLVVALDAVKGSSSLVVLDAKDLTEVARADMGAGRWVPYGFHGAFAPDSATSRL